MDMFNSEIENGQNITLKFGMCVSFIKAQLMDNFGKQHKSHNLIQNCVFISFSQILCPGVVSSMLK